MDNVLNVPEPGGIVFDHSDPGTYPKVGDFIHVVWSGMSLTVRCYVIPYVPSVRMSFMLLSETAAALAMKHNRAHDVFEPDSGMLYFHVRLDDNCKGIARRMLEAFHKSVEGTKVEYVRMDDMETGWWET
jgi:hypothetical protein